MRPIRAMWMTAALAGAGVLLFAAPASAHVTVNAQDARQGGFTRVAFRVPTESDTLSTTKVEVHLPESTPIASVSTMPVAGWTVATSKTKLAQPVKTDDGELTEAVSVITWTAGAGAAIKPGQFQEFPVSLGPLPNVDKLVFKALQTYSDGSVVRWIDESADADHPAPTLKLLPAAQPTDQAARPSPAGAAPSDDSTEDTALGLGVAGLVAGLAGLVLGALALARTRRA
jgi:periplasmic copper chaperone A